MKKSTSAISIAAALCFGFAVAAGAQTLKKYITPDGKTVYSDTPIPGAKEVGEIKPPPPMMDPASRAKMQDAAGREAQQSEALDKQLEQRAAQRDRVAAAETKLEETKRKLEEGKDPLPGERKGIVGAGTRLTDAYWDRQKANQQAVENAQKELDAARAGK